MNNKKKFKPSLPALILDFIGAVLVGVGLYEWFSGSSFVPDQYKFENYFVVIIIVGVVLMTPYFLEMLRHFRKDKAGPREV